MTKGFSCGVWYLKLWGNLGISESPNIRPGHAACNWYQLFFNAQLFLILCLYPGESRDGSIGWLCSLGKKFAWKCRLLHKGVEYNVYLMCTSYFIVYIVYMCLLKGCPFILIVPLSCFMRMISQPLVCVQRLRHTNISLGRLR